MGGETHSVGEAFLKCYQEDLVTSGYGRWDRKVLRKTTTTFSRHNGSKPNSRGQRDEWV